MAIRRVSACARTDPLCRVVSSLNAGVGFKGFANDSFTTVCDNSIVVKYADDVTIIHFIRNEDDRLQEEIDNISL